jgi:FKBP-type peptidyl-prolyl cis-trans isomerase FklB
MQRYATIGLLLAVCITSDITWAEDDTAPDRTIYLNGYTAGRALGGYYEEAGREQFISGLIEGIQKFDKPTIEDAKLREARLAWLENADLSKKDRASYTAGYLNGEAYKKPESVYSAHVFLQGLLDSLQNPGSPIIDSDQGSLLISKYQRSEFYKMKRQVADTIKENERAGKDFLKTNAQAPGISQTDSGLQFKIINEGRGDHPTAEDTVVISLVGRKIDGEVFYDSETDGNGQPTSIKVKQTLNGWQEALVRMSPGAKWEVFVPSHLAYGNAGWQGKIEPGETVVYDLELIEVVPVK